ncbi:MAG TPA: hypothetical protein VFS67_20140 [Polyangiaceae bacterium]|nr:hypothetical protein [Polyangiaceae bacterium]
MKAFASSHSSLRLVTSLGALLLALGAGSATAQAAPKSSAPTVQITEKARELFRTGVTLLQDPDGARYEEAYEQFKAAYAESPSWKILGNLGVTAMKLERDGEAIQAFQGYLERGGRELSKDERAQFQSDLDTLSATAATVTISGLPAGTRVTDVRSPNKGDDVKNYYDVPEGGPLVLRVRPGVHRFSAQWADQQAQTHELEATVKGAHEVKFEAVQPEPVQPEPVLAAPEPAPAPAPAPARDRGFFQSPLPAYISLGVGAAGVGLGVVFLSQRSAAVSDGDSKYKACLESQACGASDQRAMERLDQKASSRGTLSVVSFGVGAVGVGAGVTLLLMNGKKEAAVTAAGVTVQPYASGNELGLWGQF